MKKHSTLIILALGALVLAGACSGGNEITGPGDGRQGITPTTPVVTPVATPVTGPNPTPNPCVRHPEVCD